MERLSIDEVGLVPVAAEPYQEPWQRHSTRSAKALAFAGLTLRALGIVYGDIGTSPLYVFSTLYSLRPPTREADFIGGCSIVIWALLLMVTIKYAVFVLMADNRGEGGIFAVGSLLCGAKSNLPRWTKRLIVFMMMIGAGLLLGDGAFTPAVSVLGAVGGLSVAASGLKQYIVPISIGILVILFLAQPFGTSKIGIAFGPIILVWFSVLSISGIWRITQEPRILKAFNPYYGLEYAFAHGSSGFLSLGSVFLAVTGLEALYADIGHFGAWPVRIGWLCVAMPALTLQYLGQGALLLRDPTKISNPFYYTVPHWFYWPMLVLATFAAVIASQAIITGSFSLISQAARLGFAPPVAVKHTSQKIQGQIYVPAVNFMLLPITIAITAGFGTDVTINNAYGFTVCTTMIFTTVLFSLVVLAVWRKPVALSGLFLLFLIPDGIFWASLLDKLPHGGWVAALIALSFMVFLLCWWHGERTLRHCIRAEYPGTPIADLANRVHRASQEAAPIAQIPAVAPEAAPMPSAPLAEPSAPRIESIASELPIQPESKSPLLAVNVKGNSIKALRVPGMWVFFQIGPMQNTNFAFEQIVARTRSLPEALVFISVDYTHKPKVLDRDRLTLTHVGNGVFTGTLTIGFAESNIRVLELLESTILTAADGQLRAMARQDITLVLGQEGVKLRPVPWIAWLWRWPLLVYEHLKRLFTASYPSCVFAEHNTIVVGVRALI